MEIAELDGRYRIRLKVNKPLPDGYYETERVDIELRAGAFSGVDAEGATYTGRLTLTGPDTCRMDAVVDPRTGRADIKMMQPNQTLARLPVNRQADFKIRASDGGLTLEGSTKLGPYEWKITAERHEP
jgi:hypothetical protein